MLSKTISPACNSPRRSIAAIRRGFGEIRELEEVLHQLHILCGDAHQIPRAAAHEVRWSKLVEFAENVHPHLRKHTSSYA